MLASLNPSKDRYRSMLFTTQERLTLSERIWPR